MRTSKALMFIGVALLVGNAAASEFLVSNWGGDSVARFSQGSGAFLGNLTGGVLDGPQATRVGPDGKIYVLSELTNSVLRYNQDGTFVDTFASTGLNGPCGIAFDTAGNAYVGSFDSDSVQKFGSNGAFLGTIVPSGSGGLDGPDVGTTIGPDGNLYIPSFWNNQVLKFSTSGTFLGVFANAGSGLTQPRTILFRNGQVYIASDNGNKVLRYGLDGTLLDVFVSAGSGGLLGASGMAFGDDGNLYVSSWRNNRILRFNGATGAFMDVFANSNLNGPTFISSVPEPFSITILALGGTLLLRRRRTAR